MKLEISENALRIILKDVLNSQIFGKQLGQRIENLIHEKFKEVLNKYYNQGFEDGLKNSREKK